MTDYNTISIDTCPGKNEVQPQQQPTRSSFLNSLDRTAVVIGMLCFLSGAACMHVWSSSLTPTSIIPDSNMMVASLEGHDNDCYKTENYDDGREFRNNDGGHFQCDNSCDWHGA
mmetsp:Transcript_53762/g.61146  ORF Transcript_53762/g.61146 Transcript_53762/m.61146 type:complete len:114 (+) Transcript_53762:71-412(+)